MGNKPIVYLIPGLAADRSIFRSIKLPGYETAFIEWEDPLPGEDLIHYAERFCDHIDSTRPNILIGCSLGGIMAIEMAQFCHPQQLILISSLKNRNEFPWYLRFFGVFQFYWIIPFSVVKWGVKQIRFLSGAMKKKDMLMISTMLDKTSSRFFKWAIHQVLHWKGDGGHIKPVHIHGTKDKLFPIRYIKNAIPIKGGNHFMVVYKGKEISKIILEMLSSN